MTKKELFSIVGGGPSAVAKIFCIKPQAVSQWPDPVPEARVFELRGRRPELFEQKPASEPQSAEAA